MNDFILQKANDIKRNIEHLKEILNRMGAHSDTRVYIRTMDMSSDDEGILLDRGTRVELYKMIKNRIQELTKEFEEL